MKLNSTRSQNQPKKKKVGSFVNFFLSALLVAESVFASGTVQSSVSGWAYISEQFPKKLQTLKIRSYTRGLFEGRFSEKPNMRTLAVYSQDRTKIESWIIRDINKVSAIRIKKFFRNLGNKTVSKDSKLHKLEKDGDLTWVLEDPEATSVAVFTGLHKTAGMKALGGVCTFYPMNAKLSECTITHTPQFISIVNNDCFAVIFSDGKVTSSLDINAGPNAGVELQTINEQSVLKIGSDDLESQYILIPKDNSKTVELGRHFGASNELGISYLDDYCEVKISDRVSYLEGKIPANINNLSVSRVQIFANKTHLRLVYPSGHLEEHSLPESFISKNVDLKDVITLNKTYSTFEALEFRGPNSAQFVYWPQFAQVSEIPGKRMYAQKNGTDIYVNEKLGIITSLDSVNGFQKIFAPKTGWIELFRFTQKQLSPVQPQSAQSDKVSNYAQMPEDITFSPQEFKNEILQISYLDSLGFKKLWFWTEDLRVTEDFGELISVSVDGNAIFMDETSINYHQRGSGEVKSWTVPNSQILRDKKTTSFSFYASAQNKNYDVIEVSGIINNEPKSWWIWPQSGKITPVLGIYADQCDEDSSLVFIEYGRITVLTKDWEVKKYTAPFISKETGDLKNYFLNFYIGRYIMDSQVYEQATVRVIYDPDDENMQNEDVGWKLDYTKKLENYYGKIKPARKP